KTPTLISSLVICAPMTVNWPKVWLSWRRVFASTPIMPQAGTSLRTSEGLRAGRQRASNAHATPFASTRIHQESISGTLDGLSMLEVGIKTRGKPYGTRQHAEQECDESWLQRSRSLDGWRKPARKHRDFSWSSPISQPASGEAHNPSATMPTDSISLRATSGL